MFKQSVRKVLENLFDRNIMVVESNLLENVSVTHGAKYNYRAISYAWLLPAYFGAINHGSN